MKNNEFRLHDYGYMTEEEHEIYHINKDIERNESIIKILIFILCFIATAFIFYHYGHFIGYSDALKNIQNYLR